MKKLFILSLSVAFASSALAQSEREADSAGSVYTKTTFNNPFADRIARRAGDILTVLISETSASTFSATTTTAKTDANSVNHINVPILGQLFSTLSTGATSANSGTGTTNQNGTFSAQMSVIVKKVLPNGNLVIEGVRWIKVNKETQSFKLSGVIRQDDIAANNTIASSNIQDASITADGKGAIADRQRRGILTRLVDFLF